MHSNLTRQERLVTAAVGVGTLALTGYLGRGPSRRPLALASATLLARAATGYCPVTAATHRRALITGDSKAHGTTHALSGGRGAHLTASVVIDASPDTVYGLWREPARLSQALPAYVEVRALDETHWHWTLGTKEHPAMASWTAEIINDEPAKLLSWKTTEDATIVSAGSVAFKALPGARGTEVRVRMQYSPPFGRVGASIATLFGQGAEAIVDQCLTNVKQWIESPANSSGPSS